MNLSPARKKYLIQSELLRALELPGDATPQDALLAVGLLRHGGPAALEGGFALEFEYAEVAGRVRGDQRSRWQRLWRWNPELTRAGLRGGWPTAFAFFPPRPQEV